MAWRDAAGTKITVKKLMPRIGGSTENATPDWVALVGIGTASFSALVLELALTRLFSVILFYHFAFLAISVALLGLGSGGVFAFVFRFRLTDYPLRSLGKVLCSLSALLMIGVLMLVLRLPVSHDVDAGNLLRLVLLYLGPAIPFFLTGLLLASVLARESTRVSVLYCADLVGAALACIALVPLLNTIGAPNSILAAAAFMAISAAVWSDTRRWRVLSTLLAGAILLLVVVNLDGRLLDITYAKGKATEERYPSLFSQWNAMSRIDVVQAGDSQVITIDADASTHIMDSDPRQWKDAPRAHPLMSLAPSVANILRPDGAFAIIGPGGGIDVFRAVINGSRRIVGIEINPIIADAIMRGTHLQYSHRLYELPEVDIQIGDGRSWIRNSPSRFDVIQMSLVDTWASTAAGAFALSESSLYTTNAFKEYLGHLRPDGILAVTRWEFRTPREALRVVSVAMQALLEQGVGELERHFIVVSEGVLDTDGRQVVVVVKKTPFTVEEESAVAAHLGDKGNLNLIYRPGSGGAGDGGTRDREPAARLFSDLIRGGDPYRFSASYEYNVAPLDDDKPFFFFTLKVRQLFDSETRQAIDWKVNLGVIVLLMVFVTSILAVIAFLLVPLFAHSGIRAGTVPRMFYFVAVGLGYILVEIVFIQHFVLFLGHPTYALTVVVFIMLLSSGVGSMMSHTWLSEPARVTIPLLAIVGIVAVYVVGLSSVLTTFVGVSYPSKILMSVLLLAPLGFLMGMPFPSGLRILARSSAAGDNRIEWAWAVNAASSVLGSVAAIMASIEFGLRATLALGAAAYLLAMVTLPAVIRVRRPARG